VTDRAAIANVRMSLLVMPCRLQMACRAVVVSGVNALRAEGCDGRRHVCRFHTVR